MFQDTDMIYYFADVLCLNRQKNQVDNSFNLRVKRYLVASVHIRELYN